MQTIEVKKDFKFAERGIEVLEYVKGRVVSVSDECAGIAIAEKWAVASTKPVDEVVTGIDSEE